MRLTYLLGILPVLVSVYIASFFRGNGKYQLLTPELVHEIDELRERWDVSGVAIGVVKQGDDRRFDSWKSDLLGLGTRDGEGRPVDQTTLFSIASNTKLFAAISVGLVIANESLRTENAAPKVTWDTKMKDILPEWQLMYPVASELTDVVDLLSHRTGLPNHDMAFSPITPVREMIPKLRHLRPSTEFRRAWQYNNIAYHLASAIPEYIYGTTFAQYAGQNILQKLGMNDTYFDVNLQAAMHTGRRSQGFARKYQDLEECIRDEEREGFSVACLGTKVNIGHFDPILEKYTGHWGIVSSSKDMSTWLQVLLLRGKSPYTNETIIPESVVEMVSTGHAIPQENPLFDFPELGKLTYGMGQQMNTYRGHRIIEHIGTIPGQVSRVLRVPDLGIGLVILTNEHGGVHDRLGFLFAMTASWRVLDHLLGLQPIDWERRMKPLLSQALSNPSPRGHLAPESGRKIPSESLQGIYHNRAYGHLTLCAAPLPSPLGIPPSGSEVDARCRKIMSSQPFESRQLSAPSTYIGHFGGSNTMYLRFSHTNGSTFSVTTGQVFPQTRASLSAIYGTWDAIISHEGIGYTGGSWEAGPGVAKRVIEEGDLKGTAEVWFDKVQAE